MLIFPDALFLIPLPWQEDSALYMVILSRSSSLCYLLFLSTNQPSPLTLQSLNLLGHDITFLYPLQSPPSNFTSSASLGVLVARLSS